MKQAYFFSTLIFLLIASISQAQVDPNACKRPAKNGYAVKHFDNSVSATSVINERDAIALFNELKHPNLKLPYLNAENRCDARAHRVSHHLNSKYGINSIKVQLEGNGGSEFIGATGAAFLNGNESSTRLNYYSPRTGQHYSWGYHVATALCVRTARGDELYVFDHAMYDQPVPYQVWKRDLTQGLSRSEYKEVSAGMHNLVIRTDGTHRNKKSFESNDLQIVNQQLNADWAGHQVYLRSQPRTSSTARRARN